MSDAAALPSHGDAADTVLGEMRARRVDDALWREGRIFSLIYHPDDPGAADRRRLGGAAPPRRGRLPAQDRRRPRRDPPAGRRDRDDRRAAADGAAGRGRVRVRQRRGRHGRRRRRARGAPLVVGQAARRAARDAVAVHVHVVDELVADLRAAVSEVRAGRATRGAAATYAAPE